ELRESDLERHVELQRLRRLRTVDDVGHHARAFLELDHGDRIGRLEPGRRARIDDVAVEPRAAAGAEHLDRARAAMRAERPRREIRLAAALAAALQAQLACPRAFPEMLGFR